MSRDPKVRGLKIFSDKNWMFVFWLQNNCVKRARLIKFKAKTSKFCLILSLGLNFRHQTSSVLLVSL